MASDLGTLELTLAVNQANFTSTLKQAKEATRQASVEMTNFEHALEGVAQAQRQVATMGTALGRMPDVQDSLKAFGKSRAEIAKILTGSQAALVASGNELTFALTAMQGPLQVFEGFANLVMKGGFVAALESIGSAFWGMLKPIAAVAAGALGLYLGIRSVIRLIEFLRQASGPDAIFSQANASELRDLLGKGAQVKTPQFGEWSAPMSREAAQEAFSQRFGPNFSRVIREGEDYKILDDSRMAIRFATQSQETFAVKLDDLGLSMTDAQTAIDRYRAALNKLSPEARSRVEMQFGPEVKRYQELINKQVEQGGKVTEGSFKLEMPDFLKTAGGPITKDLQDLFRVVSDMIETNAEAAEKQRQEAEQRKRLADEAKAALKSAKNQEDKVSEARDDAMQQAEINWDLEKAHNEWVAGQYRASLQASPAVPIAFQLEELMKIVRAQVASAQEAQEGADRFSQVVGVVTNAAAEQAPTFGRFGSFLEQANGDYAQAMLLFSVDLLTQSRSFRGVMQMVEAAAKALGEVFVAVFDVIFPIVEGAAEIFNALMGSLESVFDWLADKLDIFGLDDDFRKMSDAFGKAKVDIETLGLISDDTGKDIETLRDSLNVLSGFKVDPYRYNAMSLAGGAVNSSTSNPLMGTGGAYVNIQSLIVQTNDLASFVSELTSRTQAATDAALTGPGPTQVPTAPASVQGVSSVAGRSILGRNH